MSWNNYPLCMFSWLDSLKRTMISKSFLQVSFVYILCVSKVSQFHWWKCNEIAYQCECDIFYINAHAWTDFVHIWRLFKLWRQIRKSALSLLYTIAYFGVVRVRITYYWDHILFYHAILYRAKYFCFGHGGFKTFTILRMYLF